MLKIKIKINKYKQLSKNLFALIFLITILILPFFVFAGIDGDEAEVGGDTTILSAKERLIFTANPVYNTSDDSANSLFNIINTAITIFLSLLGIIFIILIIFAGYNWMTAAGNESKVETAKKTLDHAIIGLIITVGAFAIWKFISIIL